MMAAHAVVVIDDDESVRESLPQLLTAMGYHATAFASAYAFLAAEAARQVDCLIVDVAMPGMSGPALQRELLSRGQVIPTIYITAQTDEWMRAALLADGAVACLFKPFMSQDLRAAIEKALQRA